MAYGLVIIFVPGMLILALSSLSRNSRYVALFWLGIWFVSGFASVQLEGLQVAQRQRAHFQAVAEIQTKRPADETRERAAARESTRMRADQKSRVETMQMEQMEASKTELEAICLLHGQPVADRPAAAGNRRRLAEAERDAAPADARAIPRQWLGPQYPWYWSAGVLVGLFGISAGILSLSVRSLDRLR